MVMEPRLLPGEGEAADPRRPPPTRSPTHRPFPSVPPLFPSPQDYLIFINKILSTCHFLITHNFVVYSGSPLATTKETEAFLHKVST